MTAAEQWEPPIPLGITASLPEFPVDALPVWLAEFVAALSVATQTPTDMGGCLVLAALAAAAGGRAEVEVRPGWLEPLNLYVAAAMAPGTRKTAVFSAVTRPLGVAEREAIEEARPAIIEAKARQEAARDAIKVAQLVANGATEGDRDGAIAQVVAAELLAEAITVPNMPRLLADDATPEALISLLAEHGGRIAVLSDEGDIFEVMAGRYSKTNAPNLNVYLKAHIGSPLRVDRKARGPEHVERPALTLGLAVQPEVIRSIADRPGFRGRGLLARFLWALPENNVGRRAVDPPPIPQEIAGTYSDAMSTLVKMLAEWTDPVVIPFTTEANDVLIDYASSLEPQLAPGGALGHIADWGAKLAGHVARIAGLLHLAADPTRGWSRPIQPQTATEAVRIGDYFQAHAVASFDLMAASPELAHARLLGDWCRGRERFSRRDAHRAHQSTFPKAVDLDASLALLEQHGIVRRLPHPEPSSKGGRPPAPTFEVNPSWR